MDLIEYIGRTIQVSKELKEQIISATSILTVKKGQILMKPNAKFDKLSTSVLFVETGLIRVFSLKNDKQLTMRFMPENSFSFSIERNLNNEISKFSWEALEESTIRLFDFEVFEAALDKYRELEKFARYELMKTLNEYQDLSFNSRTLSAEERFNDLMKKSPDIFLKAPLGHIASYLGITPQVLSVLRSKNRHT